MAGWNYSDELHREIPYSVQGDKSIRQNLLQNLLGRKSDAYVSSYAEASKICKIIIVQLRDP
jgi:hypothetical protein